MCFARTVILQRRRAVEIFGGGGRPENVKAGQWSPIEARRREAPKRREDGSIRGAP